MENVVKWHSPRSVPGSMMLAVLAHGILFGGVLVFLKMGFHPHEEQIPVTEEVDYETFSAPPAPAEVVKPVAKAPEPDTPEEKTEEPDTSPKELQDTQSDVAGTQAATKPQQATVGSEGTGEASATPYYKIKPKYPTAALASGVEGYVIMKIDVNEKGEVENIRVTGGQEKSMFQVEARRAVEKWKYKPFLDASGKPVKKTDHEVRVDFKLQDAA
jgi:periplasmic protein TonB